MCLIVDINVAHLVLLEKNHPNYAAIKVGLHTPGNHIRLFHGGKNTRELEKNHELRSLILVLETAGKAKKFSDDEVDAEEAKVSKLALKSNDPHVLALARISKARVLCTDDGDLMDDFRDKALIDNPRGYIYSKASHITELRTRCKNQK